MRKTLYLGQHALIFILAKSSVLIAPLLAAGILSKSLYGTVEWWLALSLSFGPLVAMGAPGLVAYGTLGDKYRDHVVTATLFVLIVASLLIILALVMPLLGLDWQNSFYGPVALQCAIVALQKLLSARLKGLGKGAWASVVESSLYLSLMCALLFSWQGFDFVHSFMIAMFFACIFLMRGIFSFVPVPPLALWVKFSYLAFWRIGLHFMAGGTLIGIFMAMPRIWLGAFASPESVAEFALVFRWLSIAVVGHQFITTVFFRKIFSEVDVYRRDVTLALTVLLVAFGSISIVVMLHMANAFNVPLPRPSSLELPWAMCIIMAMWSATASFEGNLYSVGASLGQIRAIIWGLLAQVLAQVLMLPVVDGLLFGTSYAWLFGFIVMIFVQRRELIKSGNEMFWLTRVVVMLCVIFIAASLLGEVYQNE